MVDLFSVPQLSPLQLSAQFDSRYFYAYCSHLPFSLVIVRGWFLFFDYTHSMHGR